MPALMKAFPNITAHYRSGSHTISAVWPTLTYATQWRIHKFLYSQYNRLMVGILAAAQVGHCLSAGFGSQRRREGQTPSAD